MQVIRRAAGDLGGKVSAYPVIGYSLVHLFYRWRLRPLFCVPADIGVDSLAQADAAVSWRDPGNASFGNRLVDFLDAQLGTVRLAFQDASKCVAHHSSNRLSSTPW